jgi:hypothetical protein
MISNIILDSFKVYVVASEDTGNGDIKQLFTGFASTESIMTEFKGLMWKHNIGPFGLMSIMERQSRYVVFKAQMLLDKNTEKIYNTY